MSSKALNLLTPDNIYKVSKEDKEKLNKVLGGNLSSMAFVREDEEKGYYQINPATYRDKKLLVDLIFRLNIKIEKL